VPEPPLTIAEVPGALNALGQEEFVRALGPVFEGSPWIAREAWSERPFADLEDLHAAMVAALRAAAPPRRLALVRAHPELGARAAEGLTAESTREQVGAGLDRLPDAELEELGRLNRAYRERFGFPLVVYVGEHTPPSILAWARERLGRSREEELETALVEIAKIARARLEAVALGVGPRP
jgi:2-oxo-4-hydroxy-4-carboxy-5-ureidoimidazoline decarboxylase